MYVCHRPSSPVKKGFPPEETRSAVQTYKDLRDRDLLKDVVDESFLQAYLPGGSLNVEEWSDEEGQLVSLIQGTSRGQEPSLYTGYAPLLRLLNYISKRVFEHKNTREALVFYCGDKVKVHNPFNRQHRTPDVIAVWETSQVFPTVDYSQNYLPQTTWCALATVGEAKVSKNGKHQLASYLRNHLELHPELNAALGFTAQSKGYALFYHDAEVIHQSNFSWKPGPLYAFVERLYTRPFKDTSMQILDPNSPDPVWATKIDGTVYISEVPRVLPGPGQRRYTAVALDAHSSEAVFLKDVWRDEGRWFFEALLLEQAHSGQHLSGLMSVDSHGYVLDEAGRHLKTTSLGSVAGQSNRRHKMRMATRDIGRPLYEIRSLRQFLCVMYDACAVQRNLYRKCKILHRDISDGNIMLAPETSEYKQRCVGGYAEVKFVNQVLAKEKNPDPEPACLVIDLGNGSDLKVERGQVALTERTGTPKFIARSVSSGELLNEEDFENGGVNMPPMEGPLSEYSKFMHTTEYRDLNDPDSMVSSDDVQFAHQLFHDAESTFWVIAWTLARSAGEAYQHETNPHTNYRRFYHTMVTHFPVPGDEDPRSNFKKAPTYWKSILHSDLEIMGPMLNKMFLYIRPEWAYRPDLNAEHVHEALMRLLLAEIVRIDETGQDVPLVIGARSIPPVPPGMQPLSQNSINSLSMDRSRSFPHHSLPVGQPTLSHNQSSPEAGSNTATKAILIEPEVRAKLREQGKSLVWERETCKLEAPKYVTADEET